MIEQAPPAGDGAFVARRRSRYAVIAACSLLGLLLAVVSLVEAIEAPDPPSDDLVALWLIAEVAAAVLAVPLLDLVLRRRSLGAGLALALLAPLGAAGPAALVALVAFVSLRSWRTGGLVAGVLALASAAGITVLDVVLGRGEALADLVVLAVLLGGLVLLGLALGGRRVRAERERARAVERVRAQERARIAGEMHDSLSHHLSLIALHAGALGRRDDLPPETVRSSSRLVAELSRTAHAELREVLGVLREGPSATAPPPGAAGLPDLVTQHRTAGAVVRADLDPALVADPPPERLSEATSRLLHRVSRELLANAARHAPGAPVDLVLRAGDRVTLTCRNPLRAERSALPGGLGLEGIAERVRVAGGDYRAGPVAGDFVVEVSVPW